MASDEALRREIQQLNNLIASSGAGSSSSNNGQVYASSLLGVPYAYSLRQHRPSAMSSSSLSLINNGNAYQYPNPFDRLSTGAYVNEIFPTSTTQANGHVQGVNHQSSFPSPYKLMNINSKLENGTNEMMNGNGTTARPTSVYINPSYLAARANGSVSDGVGVEVRVRPHINPAYIGFKQLVSTNGSVSCNYTTPVQSTVTSTVGSSISPQTSILMSTNRNCDNHVKPSETKLEKVVNLNGNCKSTPLKTKYKLDRRLKRSPVRKVTRTKVVNKTVSSVSPKTKLFKRYSMRMVSAITPKYSPLSWYYQNHVKRSQVGTHNVHKKLSSLRFVKPRASTTAGAKAISKKGSKSVVSINGSRYIKKNGGKTLKRLNSSSKNVVSIHGSRFIRKNGGKSLKRLSESLMAKHKPAARVYSQSMSQQQQKPGVRMASRAILKSKITLSQRIWKKKQFCVFYNRFGECKRKEKGTCPYLHDRKQLLICPKFVVGKCTNPECKLSHDLNVGRMPPCQFFNKSQCSRENCPYPHVKSSPFIKKSSSTAKKNNPAAVAEKSNSSETKSPPRKRKVSLRKENSSQTSGKKKKKDPKARYYKQEPDSQPIVSIIPRPVPKNAQSESVETDSTKECSNFETESVSTSKSNSVEDVKPFVRPVDDRRARLMSRISLLHQRVGKKESTAPAFLPFS